MKETITREEPSLVKGDESDKKVENVLRLFKIYKKAGEGKQKCLPSRK